MRKGLIAAIVASVGMLFSVAACGNNGGSSTKYEVTINNKTELQADWAGDAEARSLNLTIKKDGTEQNALEAIQDGDLKITTEDKSSSDNSLFNPHEIGYTSSKTQGTIIMNNGFTQ